MRKKAVIYPFCAELLPIVKLFEKLQTEYSLAYPVSPRGFGYAGHDAAFTCNHPSIGIEVLDEIPFWEKEWDTLLLFKPVMQTGEFRWGEVIEQAILNEKQTVFLYAEGQKLPEEFIQAERKYAGKVLLRRYPKQELQGSDDKVHDAEIPVILVGGLLKEADCFEVFLRLYEKLQKEGWKTATFSSHPAGMLFGCHSLGDIWENYEYTEAEKINRINIRINDTVRNTGANILLLEAPDAFMKYNESIVNGYGIRTYMLCQAVTPDYLICCVPFETAESEFLELISHDFSKRLGSSISAVHVSNILLDAADSLQREQIQILHADMEFVRQRIQLQKEPTVQMFNVIEEGIDTLYLSMIDEDNEEECYNEQNKGWSHTDFKRKNTL